MKALASVSPLLLSMAILLMGNGLQTTLLPIRADLEAYSDPQIGVLGSAYFIGFTLGCIYGRFTIGQVGHIRAFTAMVSIASAVALAHALLLQPVVWWLLRVVTGYCFALLYMIIESWLNERATDENRGAIFSAYTVIRLTVVTLGQLMIVLGDPAAFPLFCVASILVSVAAVPVALTTRPAPEVTSDVRLRVRRLFKVSPVGFTGCLLIGAVTGAFWAMGPVFAKDNGLDVAGVAIFMSVIVLSGALGQWPIGRASDTRDRRKVIIIACLGAAAAAIGMVVVSDDWELRILVFSILFGAFSFPIYAVCVAHANDLVEADEYVETASILILVYSIGAAIGPILASTTMSLIGADGLFAFTATAHAALAVFTVLRMVQQPRADVAHTESFSSAVVAAETVSTIDARGSDGEETAPPRP